MRPLNCIVNSLNKQSIDWKTTKVCCFLGSPDHNQLGGLIFSAFPPAYNSGGTKNRSGIIQAVEGTSKYEGTNLETKERILAAMYYYAATGRTQANLK